MAQFDFKNYIKMTQERIEKIEPTLDGRPLTENVQYMDSKPVKRFRRTKSLIYYTILILLVSPFVVMAFFWIHNSFWPKHLSIWLNSAGIRQLSQAEINKNLRGCLKDGDSNCTKAYINLLGVDKINDPAIAGLYGTTLSREGRYEEALPLMEAAAQKGKVAPATIAQLCIANTQLHHYIEAIGWCNAGLTAFGINDRQSLPIVKAFVASLIANGQQIEALTLMNQYDATAETLNRPIEFQTDRIYLEKNFGNTGKQFKIYKNKNRYETTIRIGNDKFYDAIVDTGAFTTTISKKILVDSAVGYKFVRNATARAADNHEINGQLVTIDRVYFAGANLQNVPAFVCSTCSTLIGIDMLNAFNIQTESIRGESVLTLKRK